MSSRPVRVLHLRDSPWVDGPGRTILETAKRIDRNRVDYHVGVFVSDPTIPHPLVEALRLHGLPVHVIPDRGGVSDDIVTTLIDLMSRLETDILHTSEFRSNFIGWLCRRRRGVRLVATAHGWIANDLRGKTYTLLDRALLRHFDRVILVSAAMRKRVPRWWLADRQVVILHNALMTDSYGAHPLLKDGPTRRGSHEIRILNVGRLSPEKGQITLLRAFSSLCLDVPNLRLSFAGVGPMEERLRKEVRERGLDSKVDFLGYVSDMPSLYAETDLVVQSSLTEGLPNVMLEACYLGVPVVATDVGGTSEVIQHGESGWLVRPGSVGALLEGMSCFLRDRAGFQRMAGRGRRRIEVEFGFGLRTESQMRLYEELAGLNA